jgi:hypothetical protein
MARVVIRCQYTGHYVFTGIDTTRAPLMNSGRIFCPYCVSDHVWSCGETKLDEPRKRPLVRQAG